MESPPQSHPLLHDGQPRFKLTETYWRHWRGEELELSILDRAYCHEVVWRATSSNLRGFSREQRHEAVRRRARGALYEIEAEVTAPSAASAG